MTNPAWQERREANAAAIRRMLEEALTALTGKSSWGAAWRQFVSPTERVGVKFNKITRNVSGANQALGDAILDGLAQAGVKRENIIVVEAVAAKFPGTGRYDGTYGPEVHTDHGTTRLTRFIREQVDAVINVPDLKEHDRAGVTLSLKNLSHGASIMLHPWKFHSGYCSPHIGELHSLEPIAGKRRLNILNGLRGIFHLGPSPRSRRWQWDRNSLFVSTDPVALDATCLDIIQDKRRSSPEGIPVVDLFKTRRRPVHIADAAKMGLGTADRDRIDWVRLAQV
ncbi:MAG: DUF362 domain-containing protein [bacterium]